MKQDPIVEETRKVRQAIETECDNDPAKYAERLHEVEKQYASRLVRRKPVAALRVAEGHAGYGGNGEGADA